MKTFQQFIESLENPDAGNNVKQTLMHKRNIELVQKQGEVRAQVNKLDDKKDNAQAKGDPAEVIKREKQINTKQAIATLDDKTKV